MTTTRRELFRLGLGGSTLLACGTTVPTFLARSARALADGPKREAGGPILVVIQLDGGNDGLNTVVPHGDDIYHKSRPKLALKAKDLKRIDDHVGPAPVARRVREAPRRGPAGDRPVGRLPQPEPLALRVDGHLADGPAPSRPAGTRLAGPGH